MIQEFVEAIDDLARNKANDIHTALAGTIVSFDASTCTAVVQPTGKMETSTQERIEYPQIPNVPVVFPYSSSMNVGVAFPVKSGDTCLIVFSEIELDEWQTGREPNGTLHHDLTNGMCIPGLLRTPVKAVQDANANNCVVIDGNLIVNGSVRSTGDVVASGKSLTGHTHNCPDGGGTSSAPN